MSKVAERTNNIAEEEEAPVVDFDALVKDVIEHPEKLLKSELTAEQVLELQKRLNPYSGIAGPPPAPGRKKVAAVSYTNLREDYLRRFLMTGMVGFLYQVLTEWEVPVDQRRWTPARAAPKKDDPALQPYEIDQLVERLEAALAVAKQAQEAKQLADKLEAEAKKEDVVLPAEAPAEKRAEVERQFAEATDARANAVGLLYTATHVLFSAGNDAKNRLRATADLGMKHAKVRSVLSQFPIPAPVGQIEIPAAKAKEMVKGFLDNWLRFDPSVHVRSGYDEKAVADALEKGAAGGTVDAKDPGHLTMEAVLAEAPPPAKEHRETFKTITASRQSYNAVAALLRDEDLIDAALVAIQNAEDFRRYLLPVPKKSPARPAAEAVPPQDTFHRLAYYIEVNHEELRTITEAIYPERPDLDWAIALWSTFEGTEKEVKEQFDKYCQRYQDEIPSSIKALEFGSWSLLADFKENRKKIQFYNKHTEVLKRILDRHSDDKRIGAELMRNRVRQTKAKNIAEDGPDHPGLAKYRANLAEKSLDLAGKGVEKVISPEEMKRLEKARGNVKAAKELELLEQYEKTIRELGELESLGKTLSSNEKRDLEFARANIDKVREMVAVPDDAIQVDVFTSDPATGGFAKSHFYTKAEAPDHIAATRREGPAAPGAIGRAHSDHPAVTNMTPVPSYAPYVLEEMAKAEKRTEADMKAEALADAKKE